MRAVRTTLPSSRCGNVHAPFCAVSIFEGLWQHVVELAVDLDQFGAQTQLFASSFDRIAGSLVECCEKHAIWERHVSEGIDSAVAGLLEVGVTELDESVLASSRCSNINLDQVHLRSQQHRSHVDADTNFPPTQRTNTSDENRERCRLLCLPLQSQPIYRDEVSLRRSSIGVSAPM
jgi:hypothetical protein